MRLFMQTQPAGADAPRYYQLVLQQDLLGGLTLFREWGQQGSRASSKREVYLERDAALNAFESARDKDRLLQIAKTEHDADLRMQCCERIRRDLRTRFRYGRQQC
jgi:predicted DNA-binding WGR domain protein